MAHPVDSIALTELGPLAQLKAGRMPERLLRLLLGLWLYGLSIALMIEGTLGAAPWDVFHQGAARHLPLSFGVVMVLVSVAVLLAWIPLRQMPGLGTVANALLIGPFADINLALLDTPDHLAVRCAFMLAGVVTCAFATGLYIGAQLGPGPRDGLMTGLAHRTGWSIRRVRTLIELAVLGAGVALGGVFGAGTIVFALGVGPVTQFFLERLVVRLDPSASTRRPALRVVGAAALVLGALVASGLLFNERLAPRASGAPGHALALQPAQTEIDRELAPLLAANPGRTGALLLPDGLDAFAARAMTAQKAGRSLDLQYYIWHDDLTGRLLARDVHAAAERGVRVRILLDDMNAAGLDPRWMVLDAHPNVELRLYNPFRNREGIKRGVELVQRVFSVNHRMHNKAWIADGRVAIIGGRNIGEEYFGAAPELNFRDLDLLLFGPAVAQASAIFDDFWNSDAAVPIAALNASTTGDVRAVIASIDDEALQARAQPYLDRVAAAPSVRDYLRRQLRPVWTDRLQVVSDPPSKGRGDAREGWLVTRLLAQLRSARHKALLVSPYFVPGEAGADGLAALAASGAEVGVVTNSLAANDVPAVHSGYARYRPALLRDGVRLYEIKARGRPDSAGPLGSSGASLHTKAFVVDDARGFVGSFNLDPRSADLNTEMGVLFDDPALAAGVRAEYLRLAAPQHSYWVYLGRDGEVRWLDRASVPPVALATEPDAGLPRRALARVLGWLPIESQL